MLIQVKLFAAARELAGGKSLIEAELSDEATVADLRQWISNTHPPLAPLLRSALFAIDAEYAVDSSPLRAGAEVACIPPVSGG